MYSLFVFGNINIFWDCFEISGDSFSLWENSDTFHSLS